MLSMLAAGPQRIAALTAGMDAAQLREAPAPGEWPASAVLAHLRACADMWGGGIAAILTHSAPVIKATNPRTWIKQTDYLDQEFRPSLQAFTAQRAELLAMLQPLEPEGWARTVTVTGAGRPLTRSVLDYAERLAIHERSHIKQIGRIVARFV